MADMNCPHGLTECSQCRFSRILAQVLKDLEVAMAEMQRLEKELLSD